MSFENLDLSDDLLRAVRDLGFVEPTPIQTEAIPEIITGDRDLVGLAQTGTGKTAAFALPMIQLIDFSLRQPQGLVICPTRELCMQISKDMTGFCKYIKGATVVAVYGGASIVNQISRLKKNAQIIVATPGRLLDLIKRRVVKLDKVAYVVLDEADEMLNMGFQEDIDAIFEKTPDEKRTWLFSATMPKAVARIAGNYMHKPVEVTVGARNRGAENITHIHFVINEKDRYYALKRILDYHPEIYGLVFCRTRRDTQDVAEKLIKDGYDADALHGDLSQASRDKVMRRFRSKTLQILIATDVAARGIDVQDITHVINYKLPDEPDNYTHRSGRTARAGKSGMSIALINTKEKGKLRAIEKKAGITSSYQKVPNGYAICEKQLLTMVNKLIVVEVDHDEIGAFLPLVYGTLARLTKEELIGKIVSLEFNRFLTYYKDARDINATGKGATGKGAAGSRKEKTRWNSSEKAWARKDSSQNKYQDRSSDRPGKRTANRSDGSAPQRRMRKGTQLFINVGTMDQVQKGAIVRTVCEASGISSAKIGAIDVRREFSFFDVDARVADKVLTAMKHAQIDGKKVTVNYAEKKKPVKKNVGKKKK